MSKAGDVLPTLVVGCKNQNCGTSITTYNSTKKAYDLKSLERGKLYEDSKELREIKDINKRGQVFHWTVMPDKGKVSYFSYLG